MKTRTVAIFLILAGGLAMAMGLLRGEAGLVFMKGARICLECIGLG